MMREFRLSVFLCVFLLPVAVTFGFSPRSHVINSVGWDQSATVVPCTLLFSDVREPAEAGESIEQDDSQPKPAIRRERHTLFVGNLPFGIGDADLRDLFTQCGTVELVSIPINKETGEARGFAFVDMSSPEEVESAIEKFTGFSFQGRTIRVSKSLPKDELKKQAKKSDEGAQKIYVGNIPFDATREDIVDLYSKYGTVRDAFMPIDRATGEPRGFAFVTLDEEVASQAIEETNGMDFLGRPLSVSLPLPPGEKGARRTPRLKLYVGNLSFYTSPGTLRDLFEEFGDVHDCYLPEDPATGGSRGFGFVTLDKECAEAAIRATDGLELDGRIIRVNAAQPKGSFQDSGSDEVDTDLEPDDGY